MNKVKVVQMTEDAWGFLEGQYVLDLGEAHGRKHFLAGIPLGWGRMSVMKVHEDYFKPVVETTRSYIIGTYMRQDMELRE